MGTNDLKKANTYEIVTELLGRMDEVVSGKLDELIHFLMVDGCPRVAALDIIERHLENKRLSLNRSRPGSPHLDVLARLGPIAPKRR